MTRKQTYLTVIIGIILSFSCANPNQNRTIVRYVRQPTTLVEKIGPESAQSGYVRGDFSVKKTVKEAPIYPYLNSKLEFRNKTAFAHVIVGRELVPSSRLIHEGERVDQYSQADINVLELTRNQVENFFAEQGMAIANRTVSEDDGLSSTVLNELRLSVSPLTSDSVKRLGELKIADYVVQVNITTAGYENTYFEGHLFPVRLARFGITVDVVDTSLMTTVWQGSHFLRATDLMEESIQISRRDIRSGQQGVESKFQSLPFVIRKCVEELLAEAR